MYAMRRTNIYLSEPQHRALRSLADQRGVPMSEMIREAIEAWLSDQGVTVLSEDEWQRRFTELLARRRRVAGRLDSTDTELAADITEAVSEVRRLRTARRP